MPQITSLSGSQFVQRGKKFAMDIIRRRLRKPAGAKLKTNQS